MIPVHDFLRSLATVKKLATGAAKYTPADPTIRNGMLLATLGFNPFSQQGRESAPIPLGRLGGKIHLPPGNQTLLMDQGGMFRRAGTPRPQPTQRMIGPLPRPRAPMMRSTPQPMNRGDVGLALALSRKPRRG